MSMTRTRIAASCLAVVAAACGGAPTSPSGRSGAIIAGTVQVTGGPARAPGSPAASELTASIVGTNLSAAVESSGYFQIQDAPSGTLQLLFRDTVVNAKAQIPNVEADQLVELVVQVNGTSANVVSEERTKSKVTVCHRSGESGAYRNISVSERAEPAHRAHGDAKVGEAVPGQAGKVFGSSCSVN